MTLYSDLIPTSWLLLKRRCCGLPGGTLTIAAPATTTNYRAVVIASGGQGEVTGGSSALVVAMGAAVSGDSFQLYAGDIAQASTPGDSYVKKNGVYVAYADRGRGANGNAGRAANSIGDVKLDGANSGGAPPADPSIFSLLPAHSSYNPPTPGAAGYNWPALAEDNVTIVGYVATTAAGPGRCFIEFYNGNPNY